MAVFRIEKTKDYTVMSNHHLRNAALSLKAKGLMSLMLSLPETWDYTTKGLARICKDGVDAICSTLNELERHGYLERQRIRDEKGRLSDIEYIIHESPVPLENAENTAFQPKRENPVLDKPAPDSPKRENPVLDNPVLGKPVLEKPRLENPAQLNTNTNQSTKALSTHQSIYPPGAAASDTIDEIDSMEAQRERIKDNIDYDALCEQYGPERIDVIVELMLETVCASRARIRIAGDSLPAEVVKSRMLKINGFNVEYVLDCMDKNTTQIRNIKAYILTALYNAPVTMESFYQAEFNRHTHKRE